MKFKLGCEIGYDVFDAATLIFNIEAMRGGRQTILSESLQISPQLDEDEITAIDTGNRYLRLTAAQGRVLIRYEAEVELAPMPAQSDPIGEVPVAKLPLETMAFINPSRYCPSDQLARFAGRQFGAITPGYGRVSEICNWINGEVDYISGSSDTTTTASDTFALRAGVCRDFAHLGITFCRALGIPARFVSCYAAKLVPQDFHAVFEAYLGDRWHLFDATRMAPLEGMVRIGCGRDAADTAFATLYGNVMALPINVWSAASPS